MGDRRTVIRSSVRRGEASVRQRNGRSFCDPTQLAAVATIVAGAVLLGFAVKAASAASDPIVHVYDVQITGAHRSTLSLPSKPLRLDFAYAETATWAETYKGVRLEVRTSEFEPARVELRMAGNSTVAGNIKYGLSGPHVKSCGSTTHRPEPGSLGLWGTPNTNGYRLDLRTGRNTSRPLTPSAGCTFLEGNMAKFANARVGASGDIATGWIDTRSVVLTLEFRTPQQPGQLGFPLNRLTTGAGFVLNLTGSTRDMSGRKVSRGTARIAFVPRPS
jgi:hypothetical protein